MRTLYPATLIMAIAVSVFMLQMSGLPGVLMGGQSVDNIHADEELNESVQNHSISAKGAPSGDDSGGFFQFVVGGLGKIIAFASLVGALPATLDAMEPIPWWFAWPVGLIAEAIVIIGIAEAMSQREWT